jgi:hypothetical protein
MPIGHVRMTRRSGPELIDGKLSPQLPVMLGMPAIPCIVHMQLSSPSPVEEMLARRPQPIHNSALSHGISAVARMLIVTERGR